MTNFIFEKRLDGDNAQGACGLLIIDKETKELIEENEYIDCRELISNTKSNTVFYKYGNSGYNCTLARHEYIIAQDLMKNCFHLPNFMRPIVYIKNHFIRTCKRCKDPFELINNKTKIACSDVAIFEYLANTTSFWSILKNPKLSKKFLDSIIMQVCLAIICAQQKTQFVHNDLHSNNILLIKCDKNLSLLYRVNICGTEKLFLVPTYGYIPVIIDYGYSYSKECEDMSLECADADNYGLITYQFDALSDLIRFFVVITSYNKEVGNRIKKMFSGVPISPENSWETIEKRDTTYHIEKIFINVIGDKTYKRNTKFYDQLIRLMMRNIMLPITQSEKHLDMDLSLELEKFFLHWDNVEKWLKYDYEKVYVFREFTDAVRKMKNKDYEKVIKSVNKSLYDILEKNIPLEVQWKLLIDSLIDVVGCMQNIVFEKINSLNIKRKKLLYSKLISGEHMFSNISDLINYPNHSLYDKDVVLLIDNVTSSNALIQIDKTNVYTPQEVYDIFKND